MNKTAQGTFEVTMTPRDESESWPARMTLRKTLAGDLRGSGVGEMLSAVTGTDGSAGYVAIERIEGALHGRDGSFVLQHSGIMERGAGQQSIVVVPDSGTGELAGIAGTFEIRIAEGGEHRYVFEYTLPI